MKPMVDKIIQVLLIIFLSTPIIIGNASAAGLLTLKDSNLPALTIKDHSVKVVIEDGYAMTTVEQVFYNPNAQDLEAKYSFPVPEKAAVSDFTMWIDGKPINGEVLERKKARDVYEEQKANHSNAGLTEKNEYKTFEINVFPVRPNQETKIRISYFQPAHVDSGMGRYVYPLQEGGVDEEALVFWTTNEEVAGNFSFDLVLRSGYPIANIRLPNQPQAQIIQKNNDWFVHLDNHTPLNAPSNIPVEQALTINRANNTDSVEQKTSVTNSNFKLNTDIAVYYRHAENLPGAVDLVAYKEKSAQRGTFMLTLTPGMDLKQISEGRDWVFILDVSGSMQGKYATLAQGVGQALQKMSAKDRFRIVLFNDRARELTSGYVIATAENVKQYIDAVAAVQPDNGTNVYAGLELGLKSLDADRTSSLLLVTDGVANVGITEQKDFIKLIKNYDVRLFTFIMGNSANTPLLRALTNASNGFAISVSNSDDIIGKIIEAQSKVNFEALHGAKLTISGLKTSDVIPKSLGSIYRGEQLIVFGHFFASGKATVTLEGKISGESKVYTTEFSFPDEAKENPEIERLWAYATIENLTQQMQDFGENPDMKQSITDLGVEYGLVTDYTSMIVVEEKMFQQLGIDQRNKRRLDMEINAQQLRASTPVAQHRVDTNQPMFNGNQPTYAGGAGAMDPLSLAIFSPLLFALKRRKNK